MIQAVEEANRSVALTRLGVTLGYLIHDSCSDVSTALWASMDFTKGIGSAGVGTGNITTRSGNASSISSGGGGDGCQAKSTSSERAQPVVAVVGASFSELSIALARLLTLELIPQVQD